MSSLPPHCQIAGSLSPRSPRMRERCSVAMPSRNARGNVASADRASPIRSSPRYVSATLIEQTSSFLAAVVKALYLLPLQLFSFLLGQLLYYINLK